LEEAKSSAAVNSPPILEMRGPERAQVGQPIKFDASASHDPRGRPLTFRWDLGPATAETPAVTHVFDQPGFSRVGVTVSNGGLAALGFRDLQIGRASCRERGCDTGMGEAR